MVFSVDSNENVTIFGRIEARDYNTLIEKYQAQVGLNHYLLKSGQEVLASDWNNLISSLTTLMGSVYYITSMPDIDSLTTGNVIKSAVWGNILPYQKTYTYTSSATFIVPYGVSRILVNWLYSGNGGYHPNVYINVSQGDVISMVLGESGQDNSLAKNGGVIISSGIGSTGSCSITYPV